MQSTYKHHLDKDMFKEKKIFCSYYKMQDVADVFSP